MVSLMGRPGASWIEVRREEFGLLGAAFAYHFLLFAAYYLLQPLRDGWIGADSRLPWLFQASLVLMVLANGAFGALVARLPRRRFLPLVYRFAAVNLVGFWVLVQLPLGSAGVWVARAFFLWLGVFSLFAVSVFWGFMADLFQAEQGKRLYGLLGAGGTLGQVAGSLVAEALAKGRTDVAGLGWLLLLAALLLEAVVRVVHHLAGRLPPEEPAARSGPGTPAEAASGQGWTAALEGARRVAASPYLLGICLYIFLYTSTSTFLYFAKQHLTGLHLPDAAARTAFNARLNFWVSAGTLAVQVGLTGRVLSALGLTATLAIVPLFTVAGLATLARMVSIESGVVAATGALATGLVAFAVVEVGRKTLNYALARPARELLYTVVSRPEKYAAKSLVDTFVYRAGDGVTAALETGLIGLGLPLATRIGCGLPLALVWVLVSLGLGRAHGERAASQGKAPSAA